MLTGASAWANILLLSGVHNKNAKKERSVQHPRANEIFYQLTLSSGYLFLNSLKPHLHHLTYVYTHVDSRGAWRMPPKKKRKKAKFLKKDREKMIVELESKEKDDLGEIAKEATEKLRTATFIKLRKSREMFVNSVCEGIAKDAFETIVKIMAENYIHLLKQNVKGKAFGKFEQAWLKHIEEYITPFFDGNFRTD